jgi:tetratricopeptide (TPR) repeat protein
MRVLVMLSLVLVAGASNLLGQDRAFIETKIREWEAVVAQNPKDYETLAAIAAGYGKLGENDTAVIYFTKSISVNPSYADAYIGLGSAYGFLGKPTEAIKYLKKGVSLDPKDPIGHLKLGTTLGRAARYPEAILELKAAIALKPDLPDAHLALGVSYLSTGNKEGALGEVRTLSRLDAQRSGQLQGLIDRSR